MALAAVLAKRESGSLLSKETPKGLNVLSGTLAGTGHEKQALVQNKLARLHLKAKGYLLLWLVFVCICNLVE